MVTKCNTGEQRANLGTAKTKKLAAITVVYSLKKLALH